MNGKYRTLHLYIKEKDLNPLRTIRPISVLPPIDKIFEAIIGCLIKNFYESK